MSTPLQHRDHPIATLAAEAASAEPQPRAAPPLLRPPIARAPGALASPRRANSTPRLTRLCTRTLGIALGLALAWLAACCYEWGTGQRLLPWDAYAGCGVGQPAAQPASVRVGLYEEFPVPWRLDRLRHVDFPVDLAIAATSREEFLELSAMIRQTYPQVQAIYFWPLLQPYEGYYPGTWSDAGAVRRVAQAADGLPTLWDLEMPPGLAHPSLGSWAKNRVFLDTWLRERREPVHIWRSHASMGFDPLFLQLAGMHFDPRDYPAVALHLDLYEKDPAMPADTLARIMRCGVERYGERFIPALGVLDDGHGTPDHFIRFETLRRDVQIARASGVAELWLFGVSGLTPSVVQLLHETLPLDQRS